jgi:hypothetical protein
MSYDLYGSKNLSIDEVQDLAYTALNLEFQRRSSDYLGGDYFLAHGPDDERFTVCENFLDEQGELLEPEFEGFPVLLRVDATSRAELIQIALERSGRLEHLRREIA